MSREDDHAAVTAVHEEYLRLNAITSADGLARIWSADPRNAYFNLSGHNYRPLSAWLALWRYYRPRLRHRSPWRSFDREITVAGDVAWVTCLRTVDAAWIGDEEDPFTGFGPQTRTRSTEILRREADGWRVVHAHFSMLAPGVPIPGVDPDDRLVAR
ncbi:nuclear transport factor 2 family protein [Mycobacterium sp. NAZ190054]|uniref:nuclear transport factor 2 family protein n=1 Tax=Mycobacterium sp. NAZ190054 TaxID=1747766 RepID=UPI00079A46BA|nr:nuclear transport factor 2 family protein [Mycobacterium sp. NAZ190054]KWX67210.1 hypothetical protein ASJ79_22510 [Mycobacterium sp. NAZ190054]